MLMCGVWARGLGGPGATGLAELAETATVAKFCGASEVSGIAAGPAGSAILRPLPFPLPRLLPWASWLPASLVCVPHAPANPGGLAGRGGLRILSFASALPARITLLIPSSQLCWVYSGFT